MALGQGDALPKVAVKVMGEKGPEDLNIGEFAADKKVVIFAVPGAFTPTCSAPTCLALSLTQTRLRPRV